MRKSAIVLLSGGLDSAVAYRWALTKFKFVCAYTFDYGQHNNSEIDAAKRIVDGATHRIVDLSNAMQMYSPHVASFGTYEAFNSSLIGFGKKINLFKDNGDFYAPDFVMGRNLIFLSMLCSFAAVNGVKDVVTGIGVTLPSGRVHPDCSKKFLDAYPRVFGVASNMRITVHHPLNGMSKRFVFELANKLGCLEFVVKNSISCFRARSGKELPNHCWGIGCGNCPPCVARKQGFAEFLSE